MEIKVFKDVSKKDTTFSGLTFSQWLLILSLVGFLVIDVLNAFYNVLPSGIVRILLFPIIGLLAFNAMFRPHGLKFRTWLKLTIRYHTTIQTRIYEKEGERKKNYVSQDFKPSKEIQEAAPRRGN